MIDLAKSLFTKQSLQHIAVVVVVLIGAAWARDAEKTLMRMFSDLRAENANGIAGIKAELIQTKELITGDIRRLGERVTRLEDTALTIDVMDIRDGMVVDRNPTNWIPDIYSIHRDVKAGRLPIPRRRIAQ